MTRLALALTLLAFQALAQQSLDEVLRAFTRVYAVVEENAADPVNPDQAVMEGALPGAMRALDPFSAFLTPERFEQLRQLQTSKEKGFGSIVSILPGRITVLQVLPETPMARSGIQPGDEFVAVNRYPISVLDEQQIIELLNQARQGQVDVVVRRPGSAQPLQFTLVPQEMDSRSVDRQFLVAEKIAYIRIKSFEGETATQFRDAVEHLGGENLHGLIIDLRENPGGVIDSALDIASFLLPPNTLILSARGRNQAPVEERVPAAARPYRFPLVVLINQKTASAAEILAAAVRDNQRGTLLGERSYGKGLVQRVFPLSMGAGMALTTSYYFTPNGESIQRPLKDSQVKPQSDRNASSPALTGQGGIAPHETVLPPPVNQFRYVLEGTGSFSSFATEFLRKGAKVDENFTVTDQVLDQFQYFLTMRNLRPPLSMWTANSDYARIRLETEIKNQALGVEFGDRVEWKLDPVINRALEIVQSGESGNGP